MAGHAGEAELLVGVGVVDAGLLGLLVRVLDRAVALERVVGAGLIGEGVDGDAATGDDSSLAAGDTAQFGTVFIQLAPAAAADFTMKVQASTSVQPGTFENATVEGEILMDGANINAAEIDPVLIRSKVGMVFQKPNPFPKSVYENVAYGPRIHGLAGSTSDLDEIVEVSLRKAGLWDEVKDRLTATGTSLSGGQQQRLCIARAIAISPEVILMDEPCSALDPIATARIEELIDELRMRYCIIIVTHSMQQAARVSQRTAFFNDGQLVEFGDTEMIFTNPAQQRTQDYITGRFG